MNGLSDGVVGDRVDSKRRVGGYLWRRLATMMVMWWRTLEVCADVMVVEMAV